MAWDYQFVDRISGSPTARLDLKADWFVRQDTTFGMPELRRSEVSSLLVDGDSYPAAAYSNRTLTLVLEYRGTPTPDAVATALQAVLRELDRPRNILMFRPNTTSPVFFRTFRAAPSSVRWDAARKVLTADVPAEPFALGLKETLPTVTVYNDPAEGTDLNPNPYFETDASGWAASGGTAVRSTAQFHEGVASLLLTPSGSATDVEVTFSSYVSVTAGQPVRFSAWLRSAAARNVDVFVVWSDGVTETGSASVTTPLAAATWTLVDSTATPPVGTVWARLAVAMRSTPLASHLLHIDEARLRQVGGAGGMCFDVASPKGDVEAPLFLSMPGSDVVIAGRRTSAIAVRRGGTPSGMPSVLQAEAMTVSTDTTVQPNSSVMSGSGNNYTRTTFATAAPLNERLSIGTFPAATSVDVRGTYRVFVRVRKSVAGDVIKMRMSANIDGAAMQGDTVTLPSSADLRWVDLGLLQFPLGYDPVFDGKSGVTMPVRGMTLSLAAGRTSGSGSLDIDCLLFVPADDRMLFLQWPENSGPTSYVIDAEAHAAYGVGTVGEVWPTVPIDFAGAPPMVSPGVANRVVMVLDVGTTSVGGDNLAAATSVIPYYWPRYLHVRPVAS